MDLRLPVSQLHFEPIARVDLQLNFFDMMIIIDQLAQPCWYQLTEFRSRNQHTTSLILYTFSFFNTTIFQM